MRSSLSQILLLVGVLILGQGCSESSEPLPPGEVQIQDSAGVTLVHLEGDLSRFSRPQWGLDVVYRVGEEGSGLELFRVSDAVFLPTGELAIANAGAPEVVILDQNGRLVTRFGEKGEGPGQFGTITSIHADDGTIVTYDDYQGRLTQFDLSGELLDTRRMADPSSVADLVPLVASQNGPVLAVYSDNRAFAQGGIRRDTTPLLRFMPESTARDTLDLLPTKTWSFGTAGQGATRAQVPFSPDLLSSGRGDRTAIANTHQSTVCVLDSRGTRTLSLRWRASQRLVTEDDFEEWKEWRRAEAPAGVPENLLANFLDIPYHDLHPVLNGILVTAEGGLWIAPADLMSRDEQTWLLIDRGGRSEGGLVLPEDAEVLDALGTRVAVLTRDEYDVEIISVFTRTSSN